jgi:AcrR family transcriptional regulator
MIVGSVMSSKQPKRVRDASGTKRRLLDAARYEFAQYGIAGGRVARVAAAAGCNKALIYAYFGSKDGLVDAAFAAHVRCHLDRVTFDGTDLPAYVGRLFDILEDDPTVVRLAAWYRLERSSGGGSAAVISANETRLEVLREAQHEGRLTDRWDATAILVFVQSIAAAWATRSPEFSAQAAPPRAVRRVAVVQAVTRLIAPTDQGPACRSPRESE